MREQRYDTIRPVIDIEWRATELERAGVAINTVKGDNSKHFPDKLMCVIRNIGVGPAIDVYSFVQYGTLPDDTLPARAFGTLAKNGETEEMPLSVKSKKDRKVIVVYYKDIYGKYFESQREVNRSDWKLGPLEILKIAKEEFLK